MIALYDTFQAKDVYQQVDTFDIEEDIPLTPRVRPDSVRHRTKGGQESVATTIQTDPRSSESSKKSI